jgi:drug/metabolite transporter (DMT)-like permease
MSARGVGVLLLLFTSFGWGSTWPVLKLVFAEIPPFSARALTAYLAALLLLGAATLRCEAIWPPRAVWPRLPLAAFLNVTCWMGPTTVALLYLTAAETAIVAATMPVWATLLGALVLKEALTPARLAALLLGLAGVLVLFLGEARALEGGQVPGILLMLSAAFLFALGAVLMKRQPPALPPVTAIFWQMSLGCLPLLVAALALERVAWQEVTRTGWLAVLWMVTVPIFSCYLAWFAALRRLPASAAALGTLLSPVVGVAAAAVVLGEAVGWRELLALLMTGAAILIASRAPAGRA